MKNCAYNELYLPTAQRIMGDMYDYAVNSLSIDISSFHKMFIESGIAHQFEVGNPTYVAGKNGCEVAREVVEECGMTCYCNEDIMYVDKSQEYWIGWALSYYQWQSNIRFLDINNCLPIDEIYKMYPTYHEMDISAFVETVNEKMALYMDEYVVE